MEEARLKEEEALRLQAELEEAHHKMEDNDRELEERSIQSHQLEQTLKEGCLKEEEEALRLEIELEEASRKMEKNDLELEERSIQSHQLEQTLVEGRLKEEEEVLRLEEASRKMEKNDQELEERSIQSHQLEQTLEEGRSKEEEGSLRLESELEEASRKIEEEDRGLEESQSSVELSMVTVAVVQSELQVAAEDDSYKVISDECEKVERRRSSSSSSSSSHIPHSNYVYADGEQLEEPTATTTTASVDDNQYDEDLLEPEPTTSPGEHSK